MKTQRTKGLDPMKPLARFAALVLLVTAASGASAQLTIIRNFSGGTPPANAVGGGDLQTIFNAAADLWEAAIQDNHTVTITYSWAALGGGTLGVHNLTSEGGTPHRETAGTIRFDNDGSSVFFLDPTPRMNEEYTTFTATNSTLPGTINSGRVWTGATGLASGRTDLFSVALHEIGHALGLSSANDAFVAEAGDSDVDLTSPRAPAGSAIPVTSPTNAHVAIANALMFPSIGTSLRRTISDADIMANAQISQFANVTLNPVFPTAAVQDEIVMSSVGTASGLYKLNWMSSSSTISPVVQGISMKCVMTNWGNGSFLTATGANLLRVTTAGSVSTIATLPSTSSGQALALNQDGQVAIGSLSAADGLLHVNYTGTGLQTLTTGNAYNGICRSRDNGAYYAVTFTPPTLYRVTTAGSTTSLATIGTGGLSGICYMPDQDRFAISDLSNNAVHYTSPTGTVLYSTPTPAGCQAVTYHEKYRSLYAVTTQGHVMRLSTSGTIVQSWQYTGANFSGVDVADDRNISVLTKGDRGSQVTVRASFPQSPSQPSCLGLSLALRPGLGFASGRYQHIQPDTLFFLTVCGALPFWTQGFASTTSAGGGVAASFTLPYGLSSGMMIYCAGSAVNPAFPEGLDFGTVEGVRVQ